MLGPLVLRFQGRCDPFVFVLAHEPHQVGHPFHVLLDAARNVAEGGGVVGAHQGEQIGKAFDLQAQISAGPIRPFVAKPLTAGPADVDTIERTGDGITTRGSGRPDEPDAERTS